MSLIHKVSISISVNQSVGCYIGEVVSELIDYYRESDSDKGN